MSTDCSMLVASGPRGRSGSTALKTWPPSSFVWPCPNTIKCYTRMKPRSVPFKKPLCNSSKFTNLLQGKFSVLSQPPKTFLELAKCSWLLTFNWSNFLIILFLVNSIQYWDWSIKKFPVVLENLEILKLVHYWESLPLLSFFWESLKSPFGIQNFKLLTSFWNSKFQTFNLLLNILTRIFCL